MDRVDDGDNSSGNEDEDYENVADINSDSSENDDFDDSRGKNAGFATRDKSDGEEDGDDDTDESRIKSVQSKKKDCNVDFDDDEDDDEDNDEGEDKHDDGNRKWSSPAAIELRAKQKARQYLLYW